MLETCRIIFSHGAKITESIAHTAITTQGILPYLKNPTAVDRFSNKMVLVFRLIPALIKYQTTGIEFRIRQRRPIMFDYDLNGIRTLQITLWNQLLNYTITQLHKLHASVSFSC